jgi:hypothetical protein
MTLWNSHCKCLHRIWLRKFRLFADFSALGLVLLRSCCLPWWLLLVGWLLHCSCRLLLHSATPPHYLPSFCCFRFSLAGFFLSSAPSTAASSHTAASSQHAFLSAGSPFYRQPYIFSSQSCVLSAELSGTGSARHHHRDGHGPSLAPQPPHRSRRTSRSHSTDAQEEGYQGEAAMSGIHHGRCFQRPCS